MAENTTTEQLPDAQPASPGRSGIFGKLMVAAFVGGVILLECLLAWMFLPSPEQVAATYQEKYENEAPLKKENNEDDEEPAEGPLAEVELGRFTITLHQADAGTTYRVDLTTAGTVFESKKREFDEIFAKTEKRFRDLMITEIRASKLTDLTEYRLGLIKRRILEKSNALFGERILQSVVFPEYSLIEQ